VLKNSRDSAREEAGRREGAKERRRRPGRERYRLSPGDPETEQVSRAGYCSDISQLTIADVE
jgi:hypothetical protein